MKLFKGLVNGRIGWLIGCDQGWAIYSVSVFQQKLCIGGHSQYIEGEIRIVWGDTELLG